MKKDNILFGIIGLLAGLIIGFLLTNSYNRSAILSQGANQQAPLQNGGQPPPNSGQNPSAAVPAVAEAIEKADKEPDNFDAQIDAGDMFARIKNWEKANLYFERANKIRPEDYTLLITLANLNYIAQKYDVAQKWYEAAIKMNPNDATARSDYGLTFYVKEPKDLDRAIKEYQAALAIDPKHEQTLQNLAVAFSEKKNSQGLKDTLAQLEKVNPNNQIIQKLKE